MRHLSSGSARWLLKLARRTIEATLRGEGVGDFLSDAPPEVKRHRAGVFVTLIRQGELRACWGTLEPQRRNLAEEVLANAQGVCFRDRRFPPLRSAELSQLRIVLSIVDSSLQPVLPQQVQPAVQGIFLRRGTRSAVVLPHEGRTVRRMLAIAQQKAGIAEGEAVELYAFRVHTIVE